jgi:hypothetical protein
MGVEAKLYAFLPAVADECDWSVSLFGSLGTPWVVGWVDPKTGGGKQKMFPVTLLTYVLAYRISVIAVLCSVGEISPF